MSHGFQFTPEGIVPLGAPVPSVGDQLMPGGRGLHAPMPTPIHTPAAAVAPQAARALPAGPLTGKQIAALVRARLKTIDKLLAAVPALEQERESLRALLAAAKTGGRRPRRSTAPLRLLADRAD